MYIYYGNMHIHIFSNTYILLLMKCARLVEEQETVFPGKFDRIFRFFCSAYPNDKKTVFPMSQILNYIPLRF